MGGFLFVCSGTGVLGRNGLSEAEAEITTAACRPAFDQSAAPFVAHPLQTQ